MRLGWSAEAGDSGGLRGASAPSQTRSRAETWPPCGGQLSFSGTDRACRGPDPSLLPSAEPRPHLGPGRGSGTHRLLSLTPRGSLMTPIRRPGQGPVGGRAAELLPTASLAGVVQRRPPRAGPRGMHGCGRRPRTLCVDCTLARTPTYPRYPRHLLDCALPRVGTGLPDSLTNIRLERRPHAPAGARRRAQRQSSWRRGRGSLPGSPRAPPASELPSPRPTSPPAE